jgi:hypothetical protein
VIAGACPSLADLLLAAENALPPPAQAQIARHLQACVSCQSTLATTASLMGRVRQVMKRLSERENADAAEARFQRFLTALHARKQQRVVPVTSSPFRRWIPLAATLAVAALVLWESQRAVSAADDLVRQAATIEQQRPVGSGQQLRVTFTPANQISFSGVGLPTITAEEDLVDGILTRTRPFTPDPHVASLVQMLAQHRFDWQKPLSVQHFDAWRRGLSRKRDFVIDLRDSPNITLRTTTDADGDLREVELTVERDSYRVVREALRFEGGGLVEFEQRAQWVRNTLPPAPVPHDTTTVTPTRTERPTPAAPVAALAQPDLRRWLATRFGDLSARQQFMPELRRQTAIVRQHLEDLRDLQERYPGADGAQASLAARSRLQRQVDLQYQTLRGDLSAIRPRVLSLTMQANAPPRQASSDAARSEHAPADWEERVHTGLALAATLDRLMIELRAYEEPTPPMQQRISDAFDGLWTAIYAPES